MRFELSSVWVELQTFHEVREHKFSVAYFANPEVVLLLVLLPLV